VSEVRDLAARMELLLRERPRTFYELLRELGDAEYRVILQAWGSLREARRLGRDEHGLYLLRQPSASPPGTPTMRGDAKSRSPASRAAGSDE